MSAAGESLIEPNLNFALSGQNANESPRVHQRITVILIQRNDGYFIPKISILRTFWETNSPIDC